MKHYLKLKSFKFAYNLEDSYIIEDAKISETELSENEGWLEINPTTYKIFVDMANNPKSLINSRRAYAELQPKSYLGNIAVMLDPTDEHQGPEAKLHDDGSYHLYG